MEIYSRYGLTRNIDIILHYRIKIGKKHTPEDKLIISKTKWIDTKAEKGFKKEYKRMLNEGFILRLKKRTGKGSNWHISLNPKKLKELYEMLK